MERVLDVTMARRQLGTLLDEVYHKGDIVTIERKGKPLAKIVPLEKGENQYSNNAKLSKKQKFLLEKLHSLPAIAIDQDPVDVLRKIRASKRIKAQSNYAK